jgi:hypothetical protein
MPSLLNANSIAEEEEDPIGMNIPRRGRRGAKQLFAAKLYTMLCNEHQPGIKWSEDGKSFSIVDKNQLQRVLPLYFHSPKLSSFKRQLNIYHFQRIGHGKNKGAYCHHLFQRDRPELVQGVQRPVGNGGWQQEEEQVSAEEMDELKYFQDDDLAATPYVYSSNEYFDFSVVPNDWLKQEGQCLEELLADKDLVQELLGSL